MHLQIHLHLPRAALGRGDPTDPHGCSREYTFLFFIDLPSSLSIGVLIYRMTTVRLPIPVGTPSPTRVSHPAGRRVRVDVPRRGHVRRAVDVLQAGKCAEKNKQNASVCMVL